MTGPVLDRCRSCDRAQLSGRHACGHCGATGLDREQSDGRAHVISSVEVAQGPIASPVGQTPFTLVMVRLDAVPGVRVMAAGRGRAAIGDAVRLTATDGHAPYIFTAR